jgi:hypothetical protein
MVNKLLPFEHLCALSSWCRGASEAPAAFLSRAERLGAQGIALHGDLPGDWLEALLAELPAARERLPLVAVEYPCPRPRGPRPPRLASSERDERKAALDLARAALRLGAPVLVVKLGRLEARPDWDAVVRDFAQDRQGDQERLVADRARRAPRALDLARLALDPLLDAAAGGNVTVAVANSAKWFDVPDDPEIAVLIDDFRGAPIAHWHDPAAAHIREALGFGRHALPAPIGVWLTDAAGARGGLPWGLGEVDPETVPAAPLDVVHAPADALDHELAAALSRTERRPGGSTTSPGSGASP